MLLLLIPAAPIIAFAAYKIAVAMEKSSGPYISDSHIRRAAIGLGMIVSIINFAVLLLPGYAIARYLIPPYTDNVGQIFFIVIITGGFMLLLAIISGYWAGRRYSREMLSRLKRN